jgi:dihydrofolate reductase
MKKVTLYIAQSLDGFVATVGGEVAWLDDFFSDEYGTDEFIASMDTVVQGNTTYQQFKPTYEGKNSYVFTNDASAEPVDGVKFVHGSPKNFVESLDDKTHTNIWLVGGPDLLAQFLNEGVVDEMIIFTMPVLLNDGVRLFSSVSVAPVPSLKEITKYKNGVVCSHYTVRQ